MLPLCACLQSLYRRDAVLGFSQWRIRVRVIIHQRQSGALLVRHCMLRHYGRTWANIRLLQLVATRNTEELFLSQFDELQSFAFVVTAAIPSRGPRPVWPGQTGFNDFWKDARRSHSDVSKGVMLVEAQTAGVEGKVEFIGHANIHVLTFREYQEGSRSHRGQCAQSSGCRDSVDRITTRLEQQSRGPYVPAAAALTGPENVRTLGVSSSQKRRMRSLSPVYQSSPPPLYHD